MPQPRADDTRVRFSPELSEGEKEATGSRKVKVLNCLNNLGVSCDEKTMPNIAMLGSGGGLRAMIALLGTLAEMKNQGLLDATMYLCGVSGSTWCMSTLYREKDWAEKVEMLEESLCGHLCQTSIDIGKAFEMVTKAVDGELFSLTDVWNALFVNNVLNMCDETKLSEHKDASSYGINPYPIYAAIEQNTFDKDNTSPGAWFEFTPHESGFPGLDVSVSTRCLGSKFQGGHLTEAREEKHISYLQALWGSALGSMDENLKVILDWLVAASQPWKGDQQCANSVAASCSCRLCSSAVLFLLISIKVAAEKDCREEFKKLKDILKDMNTPKSYQNFSEVPHTWRSRTWAERKSMLIVLFQIFRSELKDIPSSCAHCWKYIDMLELHLLVNVVKEGLKATGHWEKVKKKMSKIFGLPSTEEEAAELQGDHNWKLLQCLLNWTWGSTNNFLYGKGDVQTHGLDKLEVLNLIDAGLAINSAYPLVLRPARRVGLILSFDFSDGDPFETLKKASKYCEDNQIPFARIDPKVIENQDKPSDCYIFKGRNTPTIMHFPLFNTKNCPGPREIEQSREKFGTFNMSYTKEEMEELLKKVKMNVSNNKEKILEQIQRIVSSPTEGF